MTQEDIMRMARETGDIETDRRGRETFSYDSYGLERFAALVAAAEREACADICDQHASIEGVAQRCAVEIRARSNHDLSRLRDPQTQRRHVEKQSL